MDLLELVLAPDDDDISGFHRELFPWGEQDKFGLILLIGPSFSCYTVVHCVLMVARLV